MLGQRSLFAIFVALAAYYYYKTYYSKIQKPSPVVETTTGSVRGIISYSREGRTFYEYLGLPYAQPPINELRFEPPLPPKSWTGIREANQYGNECAQLNILVGGVIAGSEDCLFLNVFTPNKVKSEGRLFKTMVWLHGGIFVAGSANMYRPDFFMHEDVVLVTLNYRLAALGFMNTGDGSVLGNMGLKDQAMALKWVQQNIKKFGGDPNQVTLFGESAGGASVHFQTLSPMSEGLFHRAISQSGVVLNPWTIHTDVERQSKRYASIVGCPTENVPEMVACLKKKPVTDLLEALREPDPLHDPISYFSPTIEVKTKDAFISEHPRDIIRKGKAHRVPWMTGINSMEGMLSAPVIVRNDTMLKIFEEKFDQAMPPFIFYYGENGRSIKSDMAQIRDFYFGKGVRIDSPDKLVNYTNLITDYDWAVGFDEAIRLQSEFSPVYAYYFTYKAQFTLSNIILALKGKYPAILELSWFFISKWVNANFFGIDLPHHGPCHGDEMSLEFPLTGLSDCPIGHTDYEMSRKMVKLWTSFAKNESPLKFLGSTWLPINHKAEPHYLKINSSAEILTHHPNPERMAFWKNLRS